MNSKERKDLGPPHPTQCPKCGSAKVLPILYGYPSAEALKAALEGKIILGGCTIVTGAPIWRCAACGHEGGSMDIEDLQRELNQQ